MNKVLGNRKKTHQCAYCSKTFSFPSDLKRHVRTHTGEKPFTCRVCNKSFAQVYGLNRHLQTHTGERPFTCSVCCKAFTQACHLKAHMVIHSGYKPYQCEVCHICFSRYALLSRHKSSHTVKKPIERSSALQVDKRYFCQWCGHTFERPVVKYHVCIPDPVHLKVLMPYECRVGGEWDISDMEMDVLMHELYKPYQCTICHLAFATVSHWMEHAENQVCRNRSSKTERTNVSGG